MSAARTFELPHLTLRVSTRQEIGNGIFAGLDGLSAGLTPPALLKK